MALTDEELALLNTLMYESGLFKEGNVGKTLEEILKGYKSESDTVNSLIDAVLNDPEMCNLVLVDIDSYNKRGSGAMCFKDPSNKDVIVAYQGTGTGEYIDGDATNSEWYTNALGASESDTEPQQAANDYFEYCKVRYGQDGGDMIVTGHSNGGNKAMYVSVVNDDVDRCVAFDGEGFGFKFLIKYLKQIEKNSGKITCYCVGDDYVNPLFVTPDSFKKIYIEHGDYFYEQGEGFMYNHYMQAFFTNIDGKWQFVPGEQSGLSREIEKFMIYLIYNVPSEDMEKIAPFIGKILDALLGSKGKTLEEILADESSAEIIALFLLYFEAYPDRKVLLGQLYEVLEASGFFDDGKNIMYKLLFELLLQDHINVVKVFALLGLNAVAQYRRYKSAQKQASSERVRDFTYAKKAELLRTIDEINSEPFYDISHWDMWYRFEGMYGGLTITNYQNNISEYYRKVMDIQGTTHEQIHEIFNNVWDRCDAFAAEFSSGKIEEINNVASSFDVYLAC